MAKQVESECGAIGERDLRRDVAPDEARGPKAVQQDDGSASVAISLNVNRAGSNRNTQQIGVDGTVLLRHE